MNDITFKSKVDTWYYILLCFLIIITLAIALMHPQWYMSALMLPALVIAFTCLATKYTVTATDLIVHCGFFKQSIPIASITIIQKCNSWLSAPALSMDRLEIRYRRFESVTISPTNKDAFIAALLSHNKDIEIHI
ncbi:MAG: PH domain-containing protein [Chitinophagaceae bacterium]